MLDSQVPQGGRIVQLLLAAFPDDRPFLHHLKPVRKTVADEENKKTA
jgi:hypothetical protein